MVRIQASGCSKGISHARRSARTMSAEIQMTIQGRAMIFATILGLG
ncbi:hypothetical protein [Edaphobacter modestus]|uniref:Uncharacterized protein n=1 Tax=Edaphobacter modestus TaxID=388466 RepID=A0A4Q7YQL8_9BACT|nr:hypothetical protein [Edaphobacter modestus]RZU39065.1 hypothetical protein BDD14_0392 [Edaphobacter modestus]